MEELEVTTRSGRKMPVCPLLLRRESESHCWFRCKHSPEEGEEAEDWNVERAMECHEYRRLVTRGRAAFNEAVGAARAERDAATQRYRERQAAAASAAAAEGAGGEA